jgi:N-acetylmuramoyl-L-alanine amidase
VRARAALAAGCLLGGLAACGAGQSPAVPNASTATPRDPLAALRPPIIQQRIPFTARRKREMAAYAYRHYGIRDWRLRNPRVIVIHFTETATERAAYETFLPDGPDPELHERPGTCAHFVVDRSGRIYQLVDLGTMCRHAFGMNWTAFGIEHVGYSDAQVMSNGRQLAASQRLVRWLRCSYGIPVRNVMGHAETATSSYWRERDPRRSHETHDDFQRPAMTRYRALLARAACPK